MGVLYCLFRHKGAKAQRGAEFLRVPLRLRAFVAKRQNSK
jgi:hypothetical protein